MKNLFIVALLLMNYTVMAQIGINTTGANPDPSAMLDVSAADKGLLMPRLTTVQRDAIQNPANGLMIYNIDSDCMEMYFATGQWKFVQCGCNAVPTPPSAITGSVDVCLNQTGVNYSVLSQNGVSFYTWLSSNPNDIINGQGTNSITVDFVGAGIRTLAVVANNSCGVSDTTNLTIDSDNPNSIFTPLTGTFNQNVNFTAQTYIGATYSWTFNQGTPATSTTQNPSVIWANTGTYAVSLTITDSVGCTSTTIDSIAIINCPSGTAVFNYTGSIQQWTIPSCVTSIHIEARGAQGGDNYGLIGQNLGGKGAKIEGDFVVSGGQVLNIIVGQRGFNAANGNTANGAGGGGGGSFVWEQGQTQFPMVAAGGGGGSSLTNNGTPHYYGKDGVTTNNGSGSRSDDQYNNAPGGVNGADGYGGNGGGKGWNSILVNPAGKTGNSYGGTGGYGGGGGSGASCCSNPMHAAGAGGGYSGGGAGGSTYYYGGGGGGSYNGGANQIDVAGFQIGNGQVTISW